MPLLSTLFEQTHSLLDRKEEDWAIANYDQLRHVISSLFNSVPLIRQMLALVKRIAPIFIERRQEREATNRYKEVMYLAEKIGGEAAAEQIELNLLVADSYILRSELALNDQELAVNIAAYANEALWLCQTYKLDDRLEDCKSKIDLAEALFCAIFLVNTNIVLRLTQILARKPAAEFARAFKIVERTLHQLFKHQSWLMIRKLYQSGILQACTQASQKLNDDSYLLQMLYIQTQVNLTLLHTESAKEISSSESTTSPSANPAKPKPADGWRKSAALKPLSPSGAPSSPRTAGLPPNSQSPVLEGFSGWIPTDVPSNWSEFRAQLEAMRNEVNTTELAQNLLQPEYVQSVQTNINNRIVSLVKTVVDYCVEMVGDPPCAFSVFALGSLSRGDAAPYSDLEYGFLIAEEAKRENNYWKDLWTIFEFTFICFGERVGFHTDDQGSPKTPTFRGTPAQLAELFQNPLDAHDISTAFSMLRPVYITSYKVGRELHDSYIALVNRILTTLGPDGIYPYTKIGTLFLEDHISQLPKWTPKDNDACVELKTHFLQPLVFAITDIALANGSYIASINAGVSALVDGLGDGKNAHLGFSADFARSIKSFFLACYGLKVLAQLHYHEQFEGDKVSIAQPLPTASSQERPSSQSSTTGSGFNSTSSSSSSLSQSTGRQSSGAATSPPITAQSGTNQSSSSGPQPIISASGNVTNTIGAIYYLSRDEVYWLRVAQSVVLKPLYACLPYILAYIHGNPFSNSTSSNGLPSVYTGHLGYSQTSGTSMGFASAVGSSAAAVSGSSTNSNSSNSTGSAGSATLSSIVSSSSSGLTSTSSFDHRGSAHGSGEYSSSGNSNSFFSGVPRNWARIDPIIDASELLVDPKFDPYGSTKPTALEETKEVIRSLVATLIYRDAAVSRYRYYYKQLAADFKLLYRAAVTSHAGAQSARVQMLSYVFDSYAAADGTRPLIERLKSHFKDHTASIDQSVLQKLFESTKPKNVFPSLGKPAGATPPPASSNTPDVALIRVSQPVGWPSQSRHREQNTPSTMKPLSVARFEGQIGYELVVSLLHFALIGYGAPLIDARQVSTNTTKYIAPPSTTSSASGGQQSPAPQVASGQPSPMPAVFVEQIPADSLHHVLTKDPSRFKLFDSKSFTELVLMNIVLMCDARAEDFTFEPLSQEDPRGGHRLSRVTFGQCQPCPEPITISKERATLNVCNVLFCMPSMLQTVHPYAVEEFLGLSPTHLMTRLVHDLETLNKDWKTKLEATGVAALNRYTLPSPLQSTTSVVNVPHFVLGLLFERIVRLQKVLTNAPRSTHLDLLRAIDPLVGQIYADALSVTPTLTGPGVDSNSKPFIPAAAPSSFHGSALHHSNNSSGALGSGERQSAFGGIHQQFSASGTPPSSATQAPATVNFSRNAPLSASPHSGLSSPLMSTHSAASAASNSSSSILSAATAQATEILERLARIEARREFPVSVLFSVSSTSPKLYTRIERLRRSTHAILPSSLPSTEPVFEKSDHSAQAEELKSQLMNLAPNSVVFPREDMLKNHAMKERLLCTIDFAKIEAKKQRTTLLALFDTVRFTSQLRIRNCPELDQQRLSRLLTGETLKTLAVLDLRGMSGFKTPTLALIASLENLEYLNISHTEIKTLSVEKWTKREPVVFEKVIWVSMSRCTGLQHLLLKAPLLRHLDISGNTALTEFRVFSTQRVSLIGQLPNQTAPFHKVFQDVPTTSWYYSSDAISHSLEKVFLDATSGRDQRLAIHTALNEQTVRIIAEIIKHTLTLEHVDLSSSHIGADELIEAIVVSAVQNPSVKSLDLTNCGLRPQKLPSCMQLAGARAELKVKFV